MGALNSYLVSRTWYLRVSRWRKMFCVRSTTLIYNKHAQIANILSSGYSTLLLVYCLMVKVNVYICACSSSLSSLPPGFQTNMPAQPNQVPSLNDFYSSGSTEGNEIERLDANTKTTNLSNTNHCSSTLLKAVFMKVSVEVRFYNT